ncbi:MULTISPECIES: MFS transporter [unclassified Aliihoeflea]|uniref:MFS transporter n=1 Tax=unclassified Aliihoeflea TaxID=2628764 RepID=UPI0004A38F26|nr:MULTISPECIES: MFS transporter [unclassified Aliihoeflea]MCO6388897.1 MFS transporter [Aliihoeflea sp. 40Bstr573]
MKGAPVPEPTGWFISALGIAQICSWGTLFYGFPLIAEAMRADLGWSKPTLYGAATVGMLLAGLAAYPVGAAIDRGHGRSLMAGASVAAGILMVAWSQVQGLTMFYLVLAALGCMQAATLYEPAFAVIARRVGPLNARKGITALTLWGGFASTVFIPAIQMTIEWYGWRGALLAMAAVNVVVCGGLYFLAIDPSRDAIIRAVDPEGQSPPTGRSAVAAAMRKPAYWGLLIAWVSYAAAFASLTYHLFPLLLERGLDSAGTVIVLAVIGPAQVVGRILVRAFAAEAPVRRLGSIIVVVFPLAVIGFAFAPPEVTTIAAVAAFYGAANGMITIVRGMAVPEMISREGYGAVNGSLVGPMNIMTALAPLTAALIWQASGGYGTVLVAIFAGSVTLCAGFWFAAWQTRG